MIAENFHRIQERIASAARAAGRDPGNVRLVVVTKGHPVELIREVIAAGACCLGENYVEEALEKIQSLPSGPRPEWHMIGHVQSRKTGAVCAHFDWVHSLERLKVARRLDRCASELGRQLPVLLECNVSGEETKFGLTAWQEENWPALLSEIAEIVELPNLQVRGLMTMAPFLPDPEEARPFFQRLHRLQGFLAQHMPQASWGELSMGMSADFEVAIQEGATLVRIGTAIMGPRAQE